MSADVPIEDVSISEVIYYSTYHCDLGKQWLSEFGIYQLTVSPAECNMHVVKEPVYIYGGKHIDTCTQLK